MAESTAHAALVAPRAGASALVEKLAAAVLAAWFVYLLLGSTNGFGWIDSWHNEQRAVQLVLLPLTAAALAALSLSRAVVAIPAFPWPMWLVLAGALASSALVPSSSAGFRFAAFGELSLYVALAGLVMLAAATLRRAPRASPWIERAVLLLAAAHCVGILVRYLAALSMQRELSVEVLLLGFANPRFESALYVLLMPFVARMALPASGPRALRMAAWVVLVLLWTFNLALGTRAVLFSMALGSIAFAVLLWKRRPLSIVTLLFVSLVLGAGLYVLMFHLLPGWLAAGGALAVRADPVLSPNGRDLLLKSSLASIAAAPLLGIGPAQFAAIPHVWAAHPHNWVLQLAAEIGLPAAGIVVIGVAAWLWRIRARLTAAPSATGDLVEPALLTTLVALACGLVDGNLVMPISQSAAAIALGVLLASLPPPERAGTVARVRASVAVVGVAACVVAAYGILSFDEQPESVKRFREFYVKDRFFVPRFWEQGLLIKAD